MAEPGSMSQKVNNLVDSMSTAEIYDILMAIKENPEQGRLHLQTNPSLAYALLQAQVILGYITLEESNQYITDRVEFLPKEAEQMNQQTKFNEQINQQPLYQQPPPTRPIIQNPNPYQQFNQQIVQPNQNPNILENKIYPQVPQVPQNPSSSKNINKSLSELVRMNPASLSSLGLNERQLSLIQTIHKVSKMTPQQFESLTQKQKDDFKTLFELANLTLPNKKV